MSGAGCPRGTHPFAALPQEGLPLPGFPLDLHVLGTPPAFVLSQDQTLRRDRFIRPEGRLGVLEEWPRGQARPVGRCFLYDRHSGPDALERAATLGRGCALAFGTLFSSQGASDTQAGSDPRKGVAPTPYGRHAAEGRQPRPPDSRQATLSSYAHGNRRTQGGSNERSPTAGAGTCGVPPGGPCR